jgi:hypothetical protein
MFNFMTEFFCYILSIYLIRLLRAVTKCSNTLAMLIQRVLWPLGCIMMVIKRTLSALFAHCSILSCSQSTVGNLS